MISLDYDVIWLQFEVRRDLGPPLEVGGIGRICVFVDSGRRVALVVAVMHLAAQHFRAVTLDQVGAVGAFYGQPRRTSLI